MQTCIRPLAPEKGSKNCWQGTFVAAQSVGLMYMWSWPRLHSAQGKAREGTCTGYLANGWGIINCHGIQLHQEVIWTTDGPVVQHRCPIYMRPAAPALDLWQAYR